VTEQEPIPIAQPVLDYQPPGPRVRLRAAINVLLWLVLIDSVVALALAAHDTETIMVTGAVLALLGLAVTILATLARRHIALALGIESIAVVVATFALIYWRSWSPTEAYLPALLIASAQVICAALLTTLAMVDSRRPPT
jgi:hypothetical protein